MKKALIFVAVVAVAALVYCTISMVQTVKLFNERKNTEVYRAGPMIPDEPVHVNEHFMPGGFQDYVDYCEYVYPEASESLFDLHPNYRPVSEISMQELSLYFSHFATEALNLRSDGADWYSFDAAAQMDTDDYFHLKYRENPVYGRFGDYEIYYFDTQKSTLYYFNCVL